MDQACSIISKNRFNTWLSEGIIRKVSYQDKDISRTKSCCTYRLTEKGKKIAGKVLNNNHFTISRTQERHNQYVADIYCNLPPEQQIEAMNERDQYEYFMNQAILQKEQGHDEAQELIDNLRHASYVDMVVVVEQQVFAYEVATSNYTTQDLLDHSEYTTMIGATYTVVNIN